MQKRLAVLAFLILIFANSIDVLSQENSLKWIPFVWQSDTISGKFVEKAYMYVPVKIDDLPENFTMQLDLGTTDTQFYGNTVKPYIAAYPSFAKKLGSYETYQNVIFNGINLKMGSSNFLFDVWLRSGFGETIPRDSLHTGTAKHIGTIAPDMFKDKILIIDYKTARFAVAEQLPAEFKSISGVTFEIIKGMIILPFKINGVVHKLLFDTGSSPFALASSKNRALEIAGPLIIDSLSGPLWWGQQITFYGLNVNKSVELGVYKFGKSKVYYDKDGLWERDVFKPLNIWGLAGNGLFLDCVIILDYKNKLFMIKK